MPVSSDCNVAATILLGPTGAGKTPLGELIATRGLPDGKYVHFDFGAQLRQIDKGHGAVNSLDLEGRKVISEVLATGRLLTKEENPIALRILEWFLQANGAGDPHYQIKVVLNGLPRTEAQATAIQKVVHPDRIVLLDCDLETVWRRIHSNIGGDRTGRQDDSLDLVRFKFQQYLAETRRLEDYYAARGVPIVPLPVGDHTTPEDLYAELSSKLGHESSKSASGKRYE